MLAIGLGVGNLLMHLAGLLALDRWHETRACVSRGRKWHLLTLTFVLGVFLLHLLGAILFALAYFASGAVGSMPDALVAGISFQAATSAQIGLYEDFGALQAVQGLAAWVTLAFSIAFLIRMERTRPIDRAGYSRTRR